MPIKKISIGPATAGTAWAIDYLLSKTKTAPKKRLESQISDEEINYLAWTVLYTAYARIASVYVAKEEPSKTAPKIESIKNLTLINILYAVKSYLEGFIGYSLAAMADQAPIFQPKDKRRFQWTALEILNDITATCATLPGQISQSP